MARRLIKRYLPDPDKLRKHKHLRFLGRHLHQPHLWHLNRHSTPPAVAIGVFMALMPIPLQTIPAAALAIYFRANLPVTVVIVWLTNPITFPPILYFCYSVGTWILGTPPEPIQFEASFAWLGEQFVRIWQPLLLGCVLVATLASITAFYGTRRLWRWHVIRDWEQRRARKAQASKTRERTLRHKK